MQYRSILILEGGYENYVLMYPMDCTNPSARPPSLASSDAAQDDGQLDDIEYPSLSDITMKEQGSSLYDTSGGGPPGTSSVKTGVPGGPPTVDRSSKLAALKSYNSRRDLLREQHEIADKLLASQRECLNEELELAEIIKKDEAEEEEKPTEVVEMDEDKINESRFRIMQLDNSIEDAMLKKQLVEETKAVVPEVDSEAQDNIRIMASIRQKEEEIREIRAKRDRIAQEREEKLRLAKEQKKKSLANKATSAINKRQSPPTPPAGVAHVPSHPVVDRSVKPMTPAAIADFDVRRDFAPVYGQVVSTVHTWEGEGSARLATCLNLVSRVNPVSA